MPRARRHSDLPSAMPRPTTQTCLRRLDFPRGSGGMRSPHQIPVSLLPSMFLLLYTKRGKCAAQVWTDRTELEAVGQSPGHWTSLQHLS